MSDFVVVLAPAAESDIAEAFTWYRRRSALAAYAFRTEIFEAIDRIAVAPLSWPEDADGNRRRVLPRFPYTVHFGVAGQTVTVLAIAHHRRRPGYWQTREP